MLFHCYVMRSGPSSPFVEDFFGIERLEAIVSGNAAAWPPVLEPAAADVPPILREDLCRDWMKRGFSGMRFVPVSIQKVRSKQLREKPCPRYWALRVTGKMVWRHMAYAERNGEWHPIDGKLLSDAERQSYKPGLRTRLMHGAVQVQFRRIPVEWDGSDFFDSPKPPFAYAFHCTQRVVEAVRELNFEAFRFTPLDAVGVAPQPHLSEMPWPPSTASYGRCIGGGPPLCYSYPSGECPVPSVIEPARNEGISSASQSSGTIATGITLFDQSVIFDGEPEVLNELFPEFIAGIRSKLPEIVRKVEDFFLSEISGGDRPEIWHAAILLEEETSLDHWEIQIEGNAGDDACQSWVLKIKEDEVVSFYGAD